MNEHRGGARFHPFAAVFGIANVDDAYAVQREYVRLHMQSRGTGAAGYKIGLTSKRMQEMCGIDSPIAGVVLDDRVHGSGARLSVSAYGRIGLEFEIAVRIGRDLLLDEHAAEARRSRRRRRRGLPSDRNRRRPQCRLSRSRRALPDRRQFLEWRHCPWGSSRSPGPISPRSRRVVSDDGAVVDRGSGRDVLGHPFHAVAWLAGISPRREPVARRRRCHDRKPRDDKISGSAVRLSF